MTAAAAWRVMLISVFTTEINLITIEIYAKMSFSAPTYAVAIALGGLASLGYLNRLQKRAGGGPANPVSVIPTAKVDYNSARIAALSRTL